jgi:2-polyprenyl-6-methoxyphenol hydroxylase-like FAD-dependent oxidoreductase
VHERSVDVVVVGAGPVGLMLAGELTRHGARAAIVDKASGTKSISKALIQHVRTQEVMDAAGVSEAVRAASVPLRRVEVHAYGRHVGAWRLDEVDSPYPSPVILGQDQTERILEQRLNNLGVRVRWGCEALAVEQDASGVRVRVNDEAGAQDIEASYAVGCEGSDSVIRAAADMSFHGERYTGEQFIQADCKIRWPYPNGVSHLFLTHHGDGADSGYLMVIEMPNDVVRVFASLPDDDPPRHDDPTLDDVQAALRRLGAPDAELYDPIWLARYRTSHRTANTFRAERLLVAGDAGHVHVPIGGQGMNTGLQDAFNLGWKLASVATGNAAPGLLDSYSAERVSVAEHLIGGTDRAYRFVLHPGAPARAAVKRLGPFILRLDAVQRAFRTTLEEVGINYRGGPLSTDTVRGGKIKAGDRAPDARIVDAQSLTTTTLFDLMRGTHWTLLLFTAEGGAPASALSRAADIAGRHGAKPIVITRARDRIDSGPVATVLDGAGYAHGAFGVSRPTAYLVRPDWYVGYRGSVADSAGLGAYCQRLLPGPRP